MGQKKSMNSAPKTDLAQILTGVGLLALAIYVTWIIFRAPDMAEMEVADYNNLLQEEMGFLGSFIYIALHGMMGKGTIIFPLLFALGGVCALTGKDFDKTQIAGGMLITLVILTVMHMSVPYADFRDCVLTGLAGDGGGIIGGATAFLLKEGLGTFGTYIVLLCMVITAGILLGQKYLFNRRAKGPKGSKEPASAKDTLAHLKDAVMNFIFVEEDEEETTPKEDRPKKQRNREPLRTKITRDKEETKAEDGKNSKFERFKNFFIEENDEYEEEEEVEKKTSLKGKNSTKTGVIPKEKPVILNSIVQIHKTLDEAEPRIGLSPTEPLYPEHYGVDESVEEFQELVQKRKEEEPVSVIPVAIRKKMEKDQQMDQIVQDIPEETKEEEYEQQTLYQKPTETGYHFPTIDLLEVNKNAKSKNNMSDLMNHVEKLEKTLSDFGVKGKISDVSCGPAITRYEFQPAAGIKVSKILNLADDIALSMAVAGVRIEAPIPGKAAVGIEVPNEQTRMVGLREVLESEAFQNSKSKITVALGRDISGQAVVADLAKMPHLLIAGSTGSGKSVCINTLINSILYKASPDEVKFVMVDPKKVELGNYNGIPHLISPVVTDAKKAASALRWAVHEMERRYDLFADNGVKDMPRYNKLMDERIAQAGDEDAKDRFKKLPYIVVLIDELADLMMVAPADVEDAICRLAQLARAAGIHLVVATQRPSVDVITGIIKANMPSRIAFAVSSQTDSRTILDMGGAEKLLGRGDMLFYPTGMPKPQRVQGVYVSDQEIDRIVEAVKGQGQPVYNEEIANTELQQETKKEDAQEEWDSLIPEATKLFIENGQASISLLQRRFRVGYTRAARIVDQMEQRGIVGPYEGSKPRQIRMTMAQYDEMMENGQL